MCVFACSGGDGAEMVCSNTDGVVVVNDKYTCTEWCEQGDVLLVQAQTSCGGEASCSCTFAQGEACVEELAGQTCVL